MARKVTDVVSHWYILIEELQESTQQFYSSLEEAITRRELPNTDLSRIEYREGTLLSAKREYLRVRRHEHLFDICAAPFGNGFFISWWLGEAPGAFWRLVLLIPVVGAVLVRLLRPVTYYQMDIALMFQESVRKAVLEVIDGITEARGLRALSEDERKPMVGNVVGR